MKLAFVALHYGDFWASLTWTGSSPVFNDYEVCKSQIGLNSEVSDSQEMTEDVILSNSSREMRQQKQQQHHGSRSKQLKVFHLNTQSLKTREHFHKVNEFVLRNDYGHYDIVTISETWFNTSVTNASIAIQGYKIYGLDRPQKTGGGACAYVRNQFKVELIKDLTGIKESGLHQLWLKIFDCLCGLQTTRQLHPLL